MGDFKGHSWGATLGATLGLMAPSVKLVKISAVSKEKMMNSYFLVAAILTAVLMLVHLFVLNLLS